jgi:hypothetical protein
MAVGACALAISLGALIATPAQAILRPVYQQLPMSASGNCADVVVPTGVNLSGVAGTG